MSQIDATDYRSLSTALDQYSNDELNAPIQAKDGGADKFLDGDFEVMFISINAYSAGRQLDTVQYDITASDGIHSYSVRLADGRCQVERGIAESPRVTIRAAMPDFLRLITGKANGVQLFMTGRLKVL